MYYYLIIKSGSETGDIEHEVEAQSKAEATRKFQDFLGMGWEVAIIQDNMACDKCINTFNSKTCNHE